MFAVLVSGGKQYMVRPGSVIFTEKLEGEVGSKIQLTDVLMVKTQEGYITGTDLCQKASAFVEVEILEHKKTDKVIVFKKKRRHNYRRKKGHRQNVTVMRVLNISVNV